MMQSKGITPVISIVLLLLVTLTIFGIVYAFMNNMLGTSAGSTSENTENIMEQLSSKFRADSVDEDGNVYIRNIGENTLSNFTVFVDGLPQDSVSESIVPGSLGVLSLSSPLAEGVHNLTIASGGYSVRESISIPLKWVVELSVIGEA